MNTAGSRFTWSELSEEQQRALLQRPAVRDNRENLEQVRAIIQEVKRTGDVALRELTERLERMERKVRVLRRWVVGLGVILVGCVTLGAAGPQSLALRRLAIVDDSGTERIVLGTLDDGTAAIEHYDRDGKRRITTGTLHSGQASIHHYDRDGKTRIATVVPTAEPCSPTGSTFQRGSRSIPMASISGRRRIS